MLKSEGAAAGACWGISGSVRSHERRTAFINHAELSEMYCDSTTADTRRRQEIERHGVHRSRSGTLKYRNGEDILIVCESIVCEDGQSNDPGARIGCDSITRAL
ncbi:hypothetical protein Tco_1362692 [Tanacetum coccineum]